MTETTDSDSSSISSTYQSDNSEVECFLSKSYDISSSDDHGEELTDDEVKRFSNYTIGKEEIKEILSISENENTTDTYMYPAALAHHLEENYNDIAQCIKGQTREGVAVVFPKGVLSSRKERQPFPPSSVLFDVCVFSFKRPTMVLTFTRGGASTKAADYNSQMSKSLITLVRKETGTDISVIHGVIDALLCQNEETFKTKLSEFETTAKLMSIKRLHYIENDRFRSVVRCFLEPHIPRIPEESTKRKNPPDNTTNSTTVRRWFKSNYYWVSNLFAVLVVSTVVSQSKLFNEIDSHLPALFFEQNMDKDLSSKSDMYKFEPDRTKTITQDIDDRRTEDPCWWAFVMMSENTIRSNLFKLSTEKTGCDMSVTDKNYNNVLHAACFKGNVALVEYILSKDIVSINSKGSNGKTPILMAASRGHREVVDMLLIKGCDISAVDNYGCNVLHHASIGGSVDIVDKILSLRVINIDSKDNHGRTPLLKAATAGHRDVAGFLISRRCNVSSVDNSGNNILHLASIGGSVDMVDYILSQGLVSIDSRGSEGRTPVLLAAAANHREIVDFLISKGCNVLAVDNIGNNILHVASLGGSVDMVEYILSHGIVSTDSKNFQGMTPVFLVAFGGHREIFGLLVSKECDATAADWHGNNILHYASFGGKVEMVDYILSQGLVNINSRGQLGRSPVLAAAQAGHIKIVDFLMRKGCDMTASDDSYNNILHYASIGGSADMVEYILSRNIVSTDGRNIEGMTPVMTAALKGHRAFVYLLQKFECDMSAVDKSGNNILHYSCLGGSVDMVRHILSLEIIDIDSRGILWMTPIEMAALSLNIGVVEVLLEQGCSLVFGFKYILLLMWVCYIPVELIPKCFIKFSSFVICCWRHWTFTSISIPSAGLN